MYDGNIYHTPTILYDRLKIYNSTFICGVDIKIIHPGVYDMHKSLLPRLHTMPLLVQLAHKTHSKLGFLFLTEIDYYTQEVTAFVRNEK